MVAANLPDGDILGTVVLGLPYFDFHRGITHAAVGVLGLASVLAPAVWGLGKVLARHLPRPVRFWPLWYISLLGLLTHPLLDYLNEYGIRPWMPFSNRWYYGDLVPVVDPWLWVVLGSAVWATVNLRIVRLSLGLPALLMAAVIGWFAGPLYLAAWLAALAGALFLAVKVGRGRPVVAAAALCLFVAYLGGTAALRHQVLASVRGWAPQVAREPVERIDLLPTRPASGPRWLAVITADKTYYIGEVAYRDRGVPPANLKAYPKNLDDPCLRLVQDEKSIAVMSRFARFPQAISKPSPGGCTVFLRDLRYARDTFASWGVASATVRSAGSAAGQGQEHP